MNSVDLQAIFVLSRDSIKAGCEDAALPALDQLVESVRNQEPEALSFEVLTPLRRDGVSPATDPRQVVLMASYPDIEAFPRFTSGVVFTAFAAQYGKLFASAGGQPFADFECLSTRAAFSREATAAAGSAASSLANRHPGVMFEISARDHERLKSFYQRVFGWQYQIGTGQFAYVHFESNTPPLLGGIGQAQPNIPGFEPGHRFYLLVDELSSVIARAKKAGGKEIMSPTAVDGYHFAVIQDPEGNRVGLIMPFTN